MNGCRSFKVFPINLLVYTSYIAIAMAPAQCQFVNFLLVKLPGLLAQFVRVVPLYYLTSYKFIRALHFYTTLNNLPYRSYSYTVLSATRLALREYRI